MIFDINKSELNEENAKKLCEKVVGYLSRTYRPRYIYYSRFGRTPEINLRFEEYNHDSGIYFGIVETYGMDFLHEWEICSKEWLIKTLYNAVCAEWLED